MALEDDYRAYREMIAAGLRILCPDVELESSALEVLDEELERFDLQVVICGGNEDVEPDDRLVWIELSLDPTESPGFPLGRRLLLRSRGSPHPEELAQVGLGGEPGDSALHGGVGLDLGGVEEELFAPHEPGLHALLYYPLEEAPVGKQTVPLADAGEGGVVGQRFVKIVS